VYVGARESQFDKAISECLRHRLTLWRRTEIVRLAKRRLRILERQHRG
jgi:hypothetical protein